MTTRIQSGVKAIVFPLLSMFLLFCMAGCIWETNSTPPSKTITPTTVKQDAPIRTLGIIYPMAHPFYEMITRFAEEAAKAYPVQLIVKAPDEANLEQQIRIMETMIKQGVDGIAIDPVDADALSPVINKAVQAGIPVVCFESDSPQSNRLAFIGTNNIQAGARMGKVIDELLNGRGMILVETGMSKMKSLSERLEGMLDYINTQTAIQVLEVRYNEGNDTQALSDLETMIDAHPHFDAFVALDFVSGSTSILVWKAKGLNRYAITYGMMPEIKEAIQNGQITSAVSQNEQKWGSRIVDLLYQASQGTKIPVYDDTGTVEITINNVESLDLQ
ncbi:sugar ABC transporter substrate-binding protein [Cohnella sp.]|uniref:sugar ABC transporter substrate-binding protein n=1 Tax=Cohnella sp. TaxID=1883426 RepID=UPI00356221AF